MTRNRMLHQCGGKSPSEISNIARRHHKPLSRPDEAWALALRGRQVIVGVIASIPARSVSRSETYSKLGVAADQSPRRPYQYGLAKKQAVRFINVARRRESWPEASSNMSSGTRSNNLQCM